MCSRILATEMAGGSLVVSVGIMSDQTSGRIMSFDGHSFVDKHPKYTIPIDFEIMFHVHVRDHTSFIIESMYTIRCRDIGKLNGFKITDGPISPGMMLSF